MNGKPCRDHFLAINSEVLLLEGDNASARSAERRHRRLARAPASAVPTESVTLGYAAAPASTACTSSLSKLFSPA